MSATSFFDECYRRAREARRSAEIASMPAQKTHFLQLEQQWLVAAAMRTLFAQPDKGHDGAAEVGPPLKTLKPSATPD